MNEAGTRRGSYASLFALLGVGLIGFGAIAVDISMLRLADAEIQAVADAAAQAAIIELRSSGNEASAETIAKEVVSLNRVAGLPPNEPVVTFGLFESGRFSAPAVQTNAVRVTVDANLDLPFSSFWGSGTQTLYGTATAAVRPLHTIVVMDITNSWSPSNFEQARAGAVAVFDTLSAAAGRADRIGMVTFHGKYGTEFTELQLMNVATATGVRAQWANMRTANKGVLSGRYYPHMPRELPDEYGTDHAIGIQMAAQMFAENPDPNVYRAMLVLTDGKPAGVGPHKLRDLLGLDEVRWDYAFVGDENRSADDVRAQSVVLADSAWSNAEVHSWMISYVADEPWMYNVPHGDGYFVRTNNSADLTNILTDIAESLPVTLVE